MKKIILLILTLVFSITTYSQLANESFEAAVFPPTTPANWAVFDNGVSGTPNINWSTNANANSGVKAAFMSRQFAMPSGSISEDYLVTPAINVPNSAELKFFTRSLLSGIQAGTEYLIKIKSVTTGGAQNSPINYQTVQTWTDATLVAINSVYEEKTVPIPNTFAPGSQIFIAFVLKYTSSGTVGGNRWLVDDAKVVSNCIAPTLSTFSAGAITNSTATLGWGAVAGTTGYEIENVLASAAPTGNATGTSTTNSFPQTGLTGVTNYQFFVRSNCGGGSFSAWVGPYFYSTTIAPPVCGGNFYDSGTDTANYSNNENITTTIIPTIGTDKVTVNFSAFNTDGNADTLSIYDNTSATAGSLIGVYSGTNSPGSITATNPNGALTFVFTSDGFGTTQGWASTITCGPPPSCQKPVALQTSSVLSTTATLSWGAIANAVSYQIFYQPCNLPAPTASTLFTTTSNTNTVNISGLSPSTCYDFYVRSVCPSNDLSLWSNKVSATTQALPPVCGGNFIDSGGTTNNYSNSENITTTICPTVTGEKVTVNFTSFDTETGWDGLYVYDGDSITSPQISSSNGPTFIAGSAAGSYWGQIAPPFSFTSSSINGCLTFRFISDTAINNPGWNANVTCAPPPTCVAPTLLTANTITATTATIGWSQLQNPNNTTATAWEYIFLPFPSTAPTASSAGIASSATSVPLSNLSSDTCYDFYVRAICSLTDSSTWSGPKKFCTLIAPPVCGGNFVDNGGNLNYSNNANNTSTICPTVAGEKVTVTFNTFNTELNTDILSIYDNDTATAGTLIGSYSGTTSPGSFTATNATGCLTFVFTSNGFTNLPGWTSNITCGPAPTCQRPSGLQALAVLSTSATINWGAIASASSYQIFYQPCGLPLPTATTIAQVTSLTNSVNITGLSSNTCYDFYVRSICSATDFSTWSNPVSATTQLLPPACGGIYVDSGGTTGDYGNNQNITTTICPTIPGELVTVTFTSFNTEATYDGIYVYDGSVVSPAFQFDSGNPVGNGFPTALTEEGAFWGTTIPGPFTSTSANGCLTFVFKSEGSVVRSGWNSSVTCGPPPSCRQPNLLTTSAITQTGVILGWTQLANPNNTTSSDWQYLILPAGSPAPTATTTGWTATSTSLNNVVTGLASATCFDYYVRSVCSATDSSFWSGPKSFCTLIENDECDLATVAPVNSNADCTQVVAGSMLGSTPSGQTNACGGTQSNDVWFQFVATSANHIVSLNNVTGNQFNLNLAVYGGANCNSLNQINCSLNTQGTLSGLVVGQTYYVRVFLDATAANSNVTFDFCVGTIPPAIITNNTQYTPAQLVQDVLLNSTCASVSNITFDTSTDGIGYFDRNGSTFPFANGVVLSTGNAANAFGPNTSTLSDGGGATSSSDADLEAIVLAATGTPMNSRDATKLEFDFTPITSNIDFNFIFASEEYGTFQCNFSDSFAFLLTNLATNVTTNLAIVPNTTTPISVVTVRDALYNPGCASVNQQYFDRYNLIQGAFGNNPLSSPTNFNGQTVSLTATSPVTINQPYHIKLVIADRQDTAYDSAVFLEGSSFGIGNLNLGNNLLQATGNALCYGISQVIDTGLSAALYTFEWKKDGVLLPDTTPSIVVLTAGVYSVRVTFTGSNCVGDDSVTIEYYPDFTPNAPNNLSVCNAGGIGNFNLTQNSAVVLSNLIATDYIVKYYTTQADATANTNAIANPNSFNNTSNPQNIFIRIQNIVSGCFKTSSFVLNVQNLTPQFTMPSTIAICPSQTGTMSVTPINFVLANATYTWKKDNAALPDTTSSLTVNQTGTYEVTVNTFGCTSTSTTVVSFTNQITPVVGFSYTSPVCRNTTGTNATISPTATGAPLTSGGTFSCINPALIINPTTGEIDLSSPSDNYTITYNVPANITNCLVANSSQATLTINPIVPSVSGFSYASPVCRNVANLTPSTATGFTTGGTYSATPSGLVIDAGTGAVSSSSLSGSYTIKYEVAADTNGNVCRAAGFSTATLVIEPMIVATSTLSYSATNNFCKIGLINPTPTISTTYTYDGISSTVVPIPNPNVSYIYTVLLAGLPGLDINANTGEINLATSLPGSYTVTCTPTGATPNCYSGGSAQVIVTINAPTTQTANFSYTSPVCKSDVTNPTPIKSAGFANGGSYSSGAGLNINTNTGEITLVSSTPGDYTINYLLPPSPSTCEAGVSSSATITIDAVVVPIFTTITACQGTIAQGLPANYTTGSKVITGTWSSSPINTATVGTSTYTFTPNAGQCAGNGSLIVSVTPPNILPIFTPYGQICEGDALPVLPTTSNNAILGTWSTTGNTSAAGTIIFNFVPNSGQCALPTSMNIVVAPNPTFTISGACQGGVFTLEVSALSGNATYSWLKGTMPVGSNSPTLAITEIADYYCTVTENGCSKKSLPFTPNDIICSVQKGISPNNDGLNDSFDLSAFDVNKLEIFNRYGMLVYTKQGYKKEWFGQVDSGETLPDGTYFYMISLNKGDAKTGWIYINKENK